MNCMGRQFVAPTDLANWETEELSDNSIETFWPSKRRLLRLRGPLGGYITTWGTAPGSFLRTRVQETLEIID